MGKGALKKTIAICCSITMLATSISGAGVIVSGVVLCKSNRGFFLRKTFSND